MTEVLFMAIYISYFTGIRTLPASIRGLEAIPIIMRIKHIGMLVTRDGYIKDFGLFEDMYQYRNKGEI